MRIQIGLGFLLAVGLGAGCAMSPVVRTFEGRLSDSEIAVIENPHNISIASVDEKRVSKDLRFGRGRSVSRIEVEPGKHRIVLTKQVPKSALTGTTYNAVHPYRVVETKLWLEAVAGETYILNEVVETTPKYAWHGSIINARTGELVVYAPDGATNAPVVPPPPPANQPFAM